MIITISGKAGSGKSTVAKLLAEKLKLRHYSIGDLQRELAKEKGISLLELGELEEKDKTIDLELDNKQKKLGKEQDNFIIDGRLSALFIPHATLKVFLDGDEKIRAERILKAKRKDEKHKSIQDVIKHIKAREESENKRYKTYYKYDCYDKKNFDLVIDTTKMEVGEVVEEIIKRINKN